MDKNGMYEVSLDQALELLIRAAHQKDYDNVIYFATRIKEESKDWKKAALPSDNKPCPTCGDKGTTTICNGCGLKCS